MKFTDFYQFLVTYNLFICLSILLGQFTAFYLGTDFPPNSGNTSTVVSCLISSLHLGTYE